MYSARYSCYILNKRLFSRQIIFRKKCSNFKCYEKSVQLDTSCSMRTDGRIDTTNLTVVFLNFAYDPKTNEERNYETKT